MVMDFCWVEEGDGGGEQETEEEGEEGVQRLCIKEEKNIDISTLI